MTVALSEVASVIRGVTFDKHESADEPAPDHVPILRAGNIGIDLAIDQDLVWVPARRVSSEQLMLPGDIAICMSSGSASVVGKTATLHVPWRGSVGAFCAIVRPSADRIEPDYLSFFLRSPSFRDWTCQSTGANIKNIRKSELEAFPIAVPSRAEQRRIVDLLTRAEGIVRLRREAQRKAAELIPSIFMAMFGEPSTNPKGWPRATLGELMVSGPTNGLYKHKSAYGAGVPILRIDAFYDGVVRDLGTLKRVTLDSEAELGRFELREGDIVINRVNSPEYLGKSAIIPPLAERTVFESNMMRFSVDRSRLLPDYMIALLQTGHARQHFLANAKHAINQSSINQQDVKSLQVPVPPLRLQRAFVERVQSAQSIIRQQVAAAATAQATFNALLAQAFAP